MFVMIATHFIIITRVLRNNHMKNRIILLMMMMMMMMLLMEKKTILMTSLIPNWRWKYTIHQSKAARTLIKFTKNPRRWFERNIQKTNNTYKGTTTMNHHRVCCSTHVNAPEYPFANIYWWTTRTYLLTDTCQYLWLGQSQCF